MKVFSTAFHGLLDYATVATLPSLFRALDAGKETQQVADRGAQAVLAYSVLTRYERGVVKILPVPLHLLLDAALGAVLLQTAARQTGEKQAVRAALLGLGLFSLFASVATETD